MDLFSELNEQKRKVDFNTYDISVKELISMLNDSIIDIAPVYQRQFRWKEDRQSQLIESIFLGIPVPSLFMATNKDGSWELIDGVQRLSSIVHFAALPETRLKINLTDCLILSELSKLTQFNGKAFHNLPKNIQLEFQLKPLKVTTLSDKSDKKVRFDLFERLNTGGIALTNQEIRSCVYRGKFNDFLKDMSKSNHFKSVVKLSEGQKNDATGEEFVLRFFAFLNNYKNFDHSVVGFLNEYMSEASKKFDYKKNARVFDNTFSYLSNLPHGITRNKNRKTTPTNLYEAVSVGAALALEKNNKISLASIDWLGDEELTNYTTGASNSRSRVQKRIEFCRDKFLSQ